MELLNAFKTTLSNQNILGAIASSLLVIYAGYYCRRKGIFNETVAKTLSNVTLTLAIPFLSFTSFMKDINQQSLVQGLNILLWGLLVYILLIFVTIPLYSKYQGDEQDALRVLTIFGSTTFFGIPIVTALYGAEGTLYASIFNVGYRIFLYSYGYIKMSGLKITSKNIKTMFFNPVILATIIGLLIWIFQGSLPQVAVSAKNAAGEMVTKNYAFLRLDQTIPWLYKPMTYLSGLASPLAWLSIGATLGEADFKAAFSDKATRYFTFIKLLIVPIINILVLAVLAKTNILPINMIGIGTIVIMMATPPATVAATYAIKFDKGASVASNTSLLATLAAIIMMPIWIVILSVLSTMNIFQ